MGRAGMEQRAESSGGKIATFDRVGGVFLGLAFGFSSGVALADWEWFPTSEWGDIARIPPTGLNYAALLLPWVALLVYLQLRRRLLGPEG